MCGQVEGTFYCMQYSWNFAWGAKYLVYIIDNTGLSQEVKIMQTTGFEVSRTGGLPTPSLPVNPFAY